MERRIRNTDGRARISDACLVKPVLCHMIPAHLTSKKAQIADAIRRVRSESMRSHRHRTQVRPAIIPLSLIPIQTFGTSRRRQRRATTSQQQQPPPPVRRRQLRQRDVNGRPSRPSTIPAIRRTAAAETSSAAATATTILSALSAAPRPPSVRRLAAAAAAALTHSAASSRDCRVSCRATSVS